ncbi:MAG TPA: hypothetical protein VKV15_04540, partial [Bryobacteraceae bacterium]|nr:hypothetical protein [Bryobacteraceae bacterium]
RRLPSRPSHHLHDPAKHILQEQPNPSSRQIVSASARCAGSGGQTRPMRRLEARLWKNVVLMKLW